MERSAPLTSANNNNHLPALTGVRFFAIFHIFLFHLWSLYDMDKPDGFERLMASFDALPEVVVTFLSHGWMSTSFFFLLSGFILSYLYWSPDGTLATDKKRFWLMRLSRLYPIHIIALLITMPLMLPMMLEEDMGIGPILLSGLATLTLTQSWYPPWVPIWSWPTWALSALVFLYLIMPWLMKQLGGLSRKKLIVLLVLMPFLSLLPTAIYAFYFPPGTEAPRNWQIFIGSTPLFWVPHFVAGMLLSRVCSISRFNKEFAGSESAWLSWGDLAFLAVVVIACLPGIGEPLKFFLRHGLLMPLYMILVLDLARGRGVLAKLFSAPGMNFLGETGFSIFIWQNLVMIGCFVALMINPQGGEHQLLGASVAMLILAIASTYGVEKPLARKLRKRWLKER